MIKTQGVLFTRIKYHLKRVKVPDSISGTGTSFFVRYQFDSDNFVKQSGRLLKIIKWKYSYIIQ